jgi:hypothetical protein
VKTFDIRAGERRRIVHMVSDSIPQQVRFRAEPLGGGSVAGTVEVQGSRWLFRKPPETTALQPQNVVAKGFWDTLFSVSVIPERDVRITMESRHFGSRLLLIVLAAVVVLGVAGVIVSRSMG